MTLSSVLNGAFAKPTLLIVDSVANSCCPQGLEPREVELSVQGEGWQEDYDATLEHGADGTFVMLQESLSEILAELELPPYEISVFWIDAKRAQTAICNPEGERVAWDEATARLRDYAEPPRLTPETVSEYSEGEARWELVSAFAGRFADDDTLQSARVTLLVDEQGAVVRQALSTASASSEPDDELARVDALEQLILQGIRYPMNLGESGPPKLIPAQITTVEELYPLLEKALGTLGLGIIPLKDATPAAAEALASLRDMLGIPEAFLCNNSAQTLQAYFETTATFYQAAHWERFEGNKYLAFKLDGEPWRYLNFMGQLGVEPGLAFFPDWSGVCELAHNQPSPFALLSDEDAYDMGSREAVTLVPLASLHPDDENAITALKNHRRYRVDGEYPVPLRLSRAGIRAPSLSLESYTLLLSGIDQVVSKRRADVISSIKKTLELNGRSLSLRYPAKGDEAFETDASVGTYRLTIDGQGDKGGEHDLLYEGASIVLEVSGDATAHQITVALNKQLDLRVQGFSVGVTQTEELESDELDPFTQLFLSRDEGTKLWSNRNVYGPKPFIVQLAERSQLEPMWLSRWLEYYPVAFERISDAPRPKDDAVRVVRPKE